MNSLPLVIAGDYDSSMGDETVEAPPTELAPDYDEALSGEPTQLAPSSTQTEAHTAWALDDGEEWVPPFWTAGRITGAAVAAAVVVVGVAVWVGVTQWGGTEAPVVPPTPGTTATTAPPRVPVAPRPTATVTVTQQAPQPCVDGQTKPGNGPGDYYQCYNTAWLHVVPTFDPGSADGYGPNQPLPPLCVRFPEQYSC